MPQPQSAAGTPYYLLVLVKFLCFTLLRFTIAFPSYSCVSCRSYIFYSFQKGLLLHPNTTGPILGSSESTLSVCFVPASTCAAGHLDGSPSSLCARRRPHVFLIPTRGSSSIIPHRPVPSISSSICPTLQPASSSII